MIEKRNRRAVLHALASAAVLPLLDSHLSAQTATGGRIDTHMHFYPSFYADAIRKAGAESYGFPNWSVPRALDYMGKYHIAAGILSVSTPGASFLKGADARKLSRELNEATVQLGKDNPGRFGCFATMPMPDVEGTVEEIGYAFDRLAVDGVCLLTNYEGVYLGDGKFAPIFDELNRRRAVVFVHPAPPTFDAALGSALAVTEFPFDTSRAMTQLMYSGTVKRCPNIRFILSHAGGALPMVSNRIAEMSRQPAMHALVSQQEIEAHIRSFYYDLAITAHPNSLAALREVTSPSQILFGNDWPYAPDYAIELNIKGFEKLPLGAAERPAVEHTNAFSLFPRLAKV